MVFRMASMSASWRFASSLDSADWFFKDSWFLYTRSNSSSTRSKFSCMNSCFCVNPASSNCTLETASVAASSSFICSSKITWNCSAWALISSSRTSASLISSSVRSFPFLISVNCSSISWLSFFKPSNTLSLSFFCCKVRSTFILAVFCCKYCSCKSVRTFSISCMASSCAVRISSLRSLQDAMVFFSSSSLFVKSSISRFLPRRLPVFLKAPPAMEPPGLKYSPSKVTICKE